MVCVAFNARYQAGTLPLIFNAFSAAARTACNPSESILTGRTTITHKKGPIAGQKCYKIFDTSNILLSRELGRTKKYSVYNSCSLANASFT